MPHIAYWFDRTSDDDDPRWIVSEERDDVSTTLRVLPAGATDTQAAIAAAVFATARGLEVRP